MTGKEAWSLVSPLITPLLAVKNVNDKYIYDLYITIYKALEEYDERRETHEHETIR